MGEVYEIRKDLKRRQFTAEEIISYLQRRAELLGHTPTVKELKMDREGPDKAQIEEKFFSYPEAIKAAGLKPLRRPWPQWGDDELIELIQQWQKEHPNAILTYSLIQQNPDLPSPEVIRTRFGGIKQWYEVAGLEHKETVSPWRKWRAT